MPVQRAYTNCPICGDELVGRIDKKYCTPQCKAIYHTRRKHQTVPMSRSIDAILHRNWVILQELYEASETKKFFQPKSKLSKAGFKFEYHTTSHINKEGKTYRYIYNFGWMEFSDKEVMVVRLTKPK